LQKCEIPGYVDKRIVFILVTIFCVSLVFSACGSKEPGNVPSASNASENSSRAQIVFHDTIDDPQAEYMNTLGSAKAAGTAALDLILYETEPNVFQGYGTMTRSLNMPDDVLTIKQKYFYRTGQICAEADKDGSLTLTCGFTEDRDADTFMGESAPLRFIAHKDGTTLQKNIPFSLKLNGEKASLSIKLHDHANFVFHGSLTTDSVKEASSGDLPKKDRIIYINSLWSDSLTGGGGEYTAILLATPAAIKQLFRTAFCQWKRQYAEESERKDGIFPDSV